MLVDGKFNCSLKPLELPDGSTERINELIDIFMQAGAVEPWSGCPFVPPGVFDGEVSFLKEVGFINVVQVPSNDGEDLLCYVLTNKCFAASVSTCRVRFGVKIMDIRDRSMPIEHVTNIWEVLCPSVHDKVVRKMVYCQGWAV